jgi:hypothetical protein
MFFGNQAKSLSLDDDLAVGWWAQPEIVYSEKAFETAWPKLNSCPVIGVLEGLWPHCSKEVVPTARLAPMTVTLRWKDPAVSWACIKAGPHLLWRVPYIELADVIIIVVIEKLYFGLPRAILAPDFLCLSAAPKHWPLLGLFARHFIKLDPESTTTCRSDFLF